MKGEQNLDMTEILRRLTEKSGVSGDERPAAAAAAELLREYAQEVETDPFGNVTGYVRCGRENAPLLMLDAHIDRVGFIVTYIDEQGFLNIGACGGPDMKVLAAQPVTVYGKKTVRGVISALPPHVSSDHTKVPEAGEIAVDVGMTRDRAREFISPGDRVVVGGGFAKLCGTRVCADALDDRIGVCAILYALELMKKRTLKYDMAVCFSAQEETGERGVKQAAFRIRPDRAIAVDVSFGDTPDGNEWETAKLGSGAMIGYSAALDRGMSDELTAAAERAGIPHTSEVMPSATGTNADSIAVSGSGVKCATVSIPIRFMHTPCETADIRDAEAAAELICEYASGGDAE